MRIQPKKKERKAVSATVLKQIRRHIEFTADRFDCSKSWVVSVALADFFGVEIERYNSSQDRIRRVK